MKQARMRRPKARGALRPLFRRMFVTGQNRTPSAEIGERSIIRKPINVHELSSKVQASLSLKAAASRRA